MPPANPTQSISPLMVLNRLGVSVGSPAMATQVLRGTLTQVPHEANLAQHLSFGETTRTDLTAYVEGAEPSSHLLERLHDNADGLKALLAGQVARQIQGPTPYTGPIRNPGLKMPSPRDGFGMAFLDFDKTLIEGNSHMGLIKHGLQTRADEVRKLDNKWDRLWQTVKMTWRYEWHVLDPSSAADAVAAQLDGVPVLPAAREWADAAARRRIKRGALRAFHERAREIVRAEVAQHIKDGTMTEPLSEKDLEEEARTRMCIVSSQFSEVIRMLTDVGPEHEDLLRINPENIWSSEATFDANGCFVADDQFDYCFDENKPKMARRRLQERGIVWNPKTSITGSDDVHYDRFLLAMADDPKNRVIVDPGLRDRNYARHEKTAILYDTLYLHQEGHWEETGATSEAAGGEGKAQESSESREAAGHKRRRSRRNKGRRRFVVDSKKSFFPDSQGIATQTDAWQRAAYGAIEMLPVVAGEAILHGAIDNELHPLALAVPVGAGLLYGPLNRGAVGDLAVGAVVGGGMAYVHSGYSVLAAVMGALTLTTLKYLQKKLQFERKARELGHDGFKGMTRSVNFLWRAISTGGWAAVMRAMGLG